MPFSYSDVVQLGGAFCILAGYWLMPVSTKKSSVALVLGCGVWAYWATLIKPFPIWLFLLEFILGAMSLRTLVKTWTTK